MILNSVSLIRVNQKLKYVFALVFSKKIVTIMMQFFLYSGLVFSDEIYLFNGDRITGDIVQLVDYRLKIQTSYAGVVNIRWSEVESLRSEKMFYVGVDNETLEGFISVEDGIFKLDAKNRENQEFESTIVEFILLKKSSNRKVSGRFDAGISDTSGNTETSKNRIDSAFSYRVDQNRFVLSLLLNQGESQGIRNENNWLSHFKYDRFLSKNWYTFVGLSFEEDQFKDINLRSTLGSGLGYQIIDSSFTKLSIELSANYVSSDFVNLSDSDYAASSWALEFSRKLDFMGTKVFHRNFGVMGLNDDNKIFVRSQTGLRFPIVKNLSASGQFDIDWDKTPAINRNNLDRKTVFSIGYTW